MMYYSKPKTDAEVWTLAIKQHGRVPLLECYRYLRARIARQA